MLNTNFEPNSHFVVCFIYARAIKRGQNIHGILMKHPFDTHRVSVARSTFRFTLKFLFFSAVVLRLCGKPVVAGELKAI